MITHNQSADFTMSVRVYKEYVFPSLCFHLGFFFYLLFLLGNFLVSLICRLSFLISEEVNILPYNRDLQIVIGNQIFINY